MTLENAFDKEYSYACKILIEPGGIPKRGAA
jgi:hypothetical protein